jgi:hypothetical protein
LATISYLGPNDPLPSERHVAVVIHRDQRGVEKGYFYDSADKDFGGSGPFDWRMSEAIERAERFAADRHIPLVVVRAERT